MAYRTKQQKIYFKTGSGLSSQTAQQAPPLKFGHPPKIDSLDVSDFFKPNNFFFTKKKFFGLVKFFNFFLHFSLLFGQSANFRFQWVKLNFKKIRLTYTYILETYIFQDISVLKLETSRNCPAGLKTSRNCPAGLETSRICPAGLERQAQA